MFEKDPRPTQSRTTSLVESAFYCAIIYACLIVDGFIFTTLPEQVVAAYMSTVLAVTTAVCFILFYLVRRGFEWFESLKQN